MVWFARRPPASTGPWNRAFERLPRSSWWTLGRALTCTVVLTAAVCTAPPSSAAEPALNPVSFDDHADYNTDALGTGLGANPWGVAVSTVGDVNGDHHADLVIPNLHRDEISVMLGAGDGTFTRASTTIPSGPNTGAVALADFNSDGYLDIAAVDGGNDTVSVYLGTGGGAFAARVTYPVGAQDVFNQSVAVSDLNGDHAADLIVADGGGSTVSVLFGDGNGGFGTAVSIPVGLHPQSVATEYNSVTQKLGIAVAAAGANEVDVIPVGGDGTFGSAVSYPVGSEPGSVSAAYLNNDEIADLVVGDYGDGSVSVLIGRPDGTFADAVTYPSATGSAPESVTVADLNGDGFPDVAVANGDAASGPEAGVSVLLGDGAGALGAAQDFAVGKGPIGIAAADIDGDGKPDLITANANDDTISVLHNTTTDSGDDTGGTGDTGGETNPPASPDHRIVAGMSGDDDAVGDVGIADLDTNEFERVANDGIQGVDPVLSPDGTKVALWIPDGSDACDAQMSLVVENLGDDDDGSNPLAGGLPTICPSFLENSWPDQAQLGLAWAPDGKSLYYDDSKDASIHRVAADGSGSDERIVYIPEDEEGDALAYPVIDPADGSLWVALPDGGRPTDIGIMERQDHQPGIYRVQDGELSDDPVIAEGAIWPSFSPDGDVLAWIANGLDDDSYDWYGSLRSSVISDMTPGPADTVDAPRQVDTGSEWEWVLPNRIQVDHNSAGTFFGYLGMR